MEFKLFILTLPAVYNGLRDVRVNPADIVPKTAIGNSGQFESKSATTSPFFSPNFFLSDLPKLIDVFLSCS